MLMLVFWVVVVARRGSVPMCNCCTRPLSSVISIVVICYQLLQCSTTTTMCPMPFASSSINCKNQLSIYPSQTPHSSQLPINLWSCRLSGCVGIERECLSILLLIIIIMWSIKGVHRYLHFKYAIFPVSRSITFARFFTLFLLRPAVSHQFNNAQNDSSFSQIASPRLRSGSVINDALTF